MERRHLLGSVATSVALLSGCLSQRSAPGGSNTTTATTTTGTTADGTTTTDDEPATATDGSGLAAREIETFTHALRLNDLGRSPVGQVPRVSEFSERKRSVVSAAIDGGYETSELPTWLVEFVAGTAYVEADGTYYRIEDTFPTTEVTAEAVEANAVDGEIADAEAYRSAVTHDGLVMSGLTRIAAQEGITLTYVWPSLRDFFDTYDAVRYHGKVYEFEVSETDPGPPYEVTAERASLSDLARGSVWDATGASDPIRSIVRAAGQHEGLYPLNDPPEDLIAKLDAHDHVYLDGHFYTTYVEKRGPLPVTLSASFVGSDDGHPRIRIALQNDADRPIEITSGAPAPFGVLYYQPVGAPDDRTVCWTDAYAESDHVYTDGHHVEKWNSIGITTPVDPGGSVAHEYALERDDFAADEYVIGNSLGISLGEDDGGSFPFRIRFGPV